MHQITPTVYKATVIGAGPAGIACVGNLVDKLKLSHEKVLWIDPQFSSGRLEKYPHVPSNTKVCLFTRYAESCESFSCKNSKIYNKLLKEFDQQKGCELGWASELCKELTKELKGKVVTFSGNVESLQNEIDNVWEIKAKDEDENSEIFKSKLVFLTTGSKPKSISNSNSIDLDDALNPQILEKRIGKNETIAVYGSSHSAMLVLKNLLDSSNCPNEILNFYRQEIKFAQFPDPLNEPDKILHDNTGLKGETAEWVKSWIGMSSEELECKFGLKRIRGDGNEEKSFKIDKNIFAIGYERNILPKISYKSSQIDSIDYTPTGQIIKPKDSSIIEGLFGFGIAFPERVKDLDGTEEMAVGMWKFMKHIKRNIELINTE